MAMTTSNPTVIREAAAAWKLLNGIVCIYKQPGISLPKSIHNIKEKLCSDLNSLERMPRFDVVKMRRIPSTTLSNSNHGTPEANTEKEEVIAKIPDGNHTIEVFKTENYAHHPLVVGKGYQTQDIWTNVASYLAKDCSGLALLGVNDGCQLSKLIQTNKWIKSYSVSGQFGKATDTFFVTGKILQKTTFHNIRRHMIDRMLGASQASHQRIAFATAGVRLDSEQAYELASKGLVRPDSSYPLIYHVKCLKFDPPDFELEMHTINESEGFLRQYVHELGLKLHSTAVCTKIRCFKVGPFNLDMALLSKHWTLEHTIENINKTATVLKDINLYERQPLIDAEKLI